MWHLGTEKIQLGEYTWLGGNLNNLYSGALSVDIYVCSECKKVEFYMAEELETEPKEGLSTVLCPKCGNEYNILFDDCPICKIQISY